MVWPFKHKHKVPSGYGFDGSPYGRLMYFGSDGLGTGHWAVMVRCETCRKQFALSSFHVPKGQPVMPSPAPAGNQPQLQGS